MNYTFFITFLLYVLCDATAYVIVIQRHNVVSGSIVNSLSTTHQQQQTASPVPQVMTLSSQQTVHTYADIQRDTERILAQPLIANKGTPLSLPKSNGIVTSSGFGFDKNNLRTNILADNINNQFTQTEIPTVEQIEQRSSIISEGCLKNLISAYEKLRKEDSVKRKYGYCERSSKLAVITLPDSSSLVSLFILQIFFFLFCFFILFFLNIRITKQKLII